jgi:hypothetical protein
MKSYQAAITISIIIISDDQANQGIAAQLSGQIPFSLTADVPSLTMDWSLTGTFCAQGRCWFTGGGALIDPLLGIPVADIQVKNNSKTPDSSFGGNVYPGGSATAGGGSNWNHVDRTLNCISTGQISS